MSHSDGSFEYPQHTLWSRDKKNYFQIITPSGTLSDCQTVWMQMLCGPDLGPYYLQRYQPMTNVTTGKEGLRDNDCAFWNDYIPDGGIKTKDKTNNSNCELDYKHFILLH